MTLTDRKRIAREELKSGEVLCQYCPAKCCRYFALPIETPTHFKDFEFIRWYLLHERATIFTEEEDWYLLVHTGCRHLGDDKRCEAYDTRPRICRDYSTEACEYEEDWTYERYFETPDQVHEYAEAILQKSGRDIRGPQPSALPIVG